MEDARIPSWASRSRKIGGTRLYAPTNNQDLSTLAPLIGGTINTKTITAHWDEILRLSTSIKTGTVTASLMMRKLGAYPRQNGLATALRELGKLERTLFLLDWLQDPDLRRKVTAGLNLLTAANVLWNTVNLDRTIATLNQGDKAPGPELLRFLSPLGWEHINLTGDYTWPRTNKIKPGKYRPLRRSARS